MCNCDITYNQIQVAIKELSDSEHRYRLSHDFWSESISYTCYTCKNKWLEVGEIIKCPSCKKMVCTYCLFYYNKRPSITFA
jgi:hypothetical protein